MKWWRFDNNCVIRWTQWSMIIIFVFGLVLFYYDQSSSCFLPPYNHYGNKNNNNLHHDISSQQKQSAFHSNLYHQLQFPFDSYSCLPQHIHISQASNVVVVVVHNDDDASTEEEYYGVNMTISFDLNYHKCRNVIPPYIIYGKAQTNNIFSSWKTKYQFAGAPIHYNFTSSLTGDYYESNWIYHVTLENLTPNEPYWYQIIVPKGTIHSTNTNNNPRRHDPEKTKHHHLFLRGLGSFGGKSPQLHFRTPPRPGTATSIALVGDIGQTWNSTKTMAHIYKAATSTTTTTRTKQPPPPPISLVMIAGDLSYADSDPHRWSRWLSLMEPLLRKVPLEVAAGNHEIECDGITGDIFVPYEHLFRNANRLGPARTRPIMVDSTSHNNNREWCSTPSRFLGQYDYGNSFYTFQHGLAQMIVLSSYTDTSPSSPQYRFLQQTLENDFVDRTLTPWLIVIFHCPIYTTFLGHVKEPQAMRMKEYMEPLFVQYGVNLVITGHDHAYSRSKPMGLNGTTTGPIYLALGAGGNREQHSPGYQHPDEPESWIAKRSLHDYGYGHLFLTNATHAYYRWIKDYGFVQPDFTDHVWIENQHILF